jgi:hypothetical protein
MGRRHDIHIKLSVLKAVVMGREYPLRLSLSHPFHDGPPARKPGSRISLSPTLLRMIPPSDDYDQVRPGEWKLWEVDRYVCDDSSLLRIRYACFRGRLNLTLLVRDHGAPLLKTYPGKGNVAYAV